MNQKYVTKIDIKGPVCNICGDLLALIKWKIRACVFSCVKSQCLQSVGIYSFICIKSRFSCRQTSDVAAPVGKTRGQAELGWHCQMGFTDEGTTFAEQRWSHLLPARRVILPVHTVLFNLLSLFKWLGDNAGLKATTWHTHTGRRSMQYAFLPLDVMKSFTHWAFNITLEINDSAL